MTGRAFLDACRFGGPVGALLGIALIGYLAAWAATESGSLSIGEAILPGLVLGAFGALVGCAVAFAALVIASIAADYAGGGRRVRMQMIGAVAALLSTFAALAGINLVRGMYPGAWALVPPLLVGGYAAVVAWFRVPKILAR